MSCSQEVFALRKAQKLDEALARVRECYRENPTDIWVPALPVVYSGETV